MVVLTACGIGTKLLLASGVGAGSASVAVRGVVQCQDSFPLHDPLLFSPLHRSFDTLLETALIYDR